MPEPRRGGTPTPFWSGTISFGLVAIPVDFYVATRREPAGRRMLAPDGTAVRREYVCPAHEHPLEPDEIVHGVELDDGSFVVVTDEELEALEPRASRTIDLREFVPREQIDPMLFRRSYFLLPDARALKPYRLLARVLEHSRRVAIATFVMHERRRLVAIMAVDGLLRAQTLRFASELRSWEGVGLPPAPESLDPSKVERMRERIIARTRADIDLDELRDEASVRLHALVERKLAEGRDIVAPPPPEPGAEAEIIDVMEVLRRSLARPEPAPQASQ